MDINKKKDDRLSLRINKDDKKKIQIRAIEKGFKNITDYVLYCCMREISESEVINKQMKK
ncbi:hypothetical protein FGL68_07070 [Acinetobacter baumannii]|nr:hypothetical protein [Acinetobacter baumannii]